MTEQLWTKTERETEDAHICCDATCATPHSAMPLRRVAAGALLIEDGEQARATIELAAIYLDEDYQNTAAALRALLPAVGWQR